MAALLMILLVVVCSCRVYLSVGYSSLASSCKYSSSGCSAGEGVTIVSLVSSCRGLLGADWEGGGGGGFGWCRFCRSSSISSVRCSRELFAPSLIRSVMVLSHPVVPSGRYAVACTVIVSGGEGLGSIFIVGFQVVCLPCADSTRWKRVASISGVCPPGLRKQRSYIPGVGFFALSSPCFSRLRGVRYRYSANVVLSISRLRISLTASWNSALCSGIVRRISLPIPSHRVIG